MTELMSHGFVHQKRQIVQFLAATDDVFVKIVEMDGDDVTLSKLTFESLLTESQ
jgi:hypothetical protein